MFVQHSLTIRRAGGIESLMSISAGPGAAAGAGYGGNAYGAASAAPRSAPPMDSTDTSSSSSTNVTDEAKAYLAAHADEAVDLSSQTRATLSW
jgi:hypothetical protein